MGRWPSWEKSELEIEKVVSHAATDVGKIPQGESMLGEMRSGPGFLKARGNRRCQGNRKNTRTTEADKGRGGSQEKNHQPCPCLGEIPEEDEP